MINRLKIQNFRSIADAELQFGRVNLFIGPNGGGKSNVLEAIGVASAALGRSIKPEDLNLRGVRLSLPRLFKATFKHRPIPRAFNISLVAGKVECGFVIQAGDTSRNLELSHESIDYDDYRILSRSPRGFKIQSLDGDGAEKPIPELTKDRGLYDQLKIVVDLPTDLRLTLDDISRYAIYAPQTAVLRGVASDPRAVEPVGLTGGRLAAAFNETIKFIRDRSIKDDEKKAATDALNLIWTSGWVDQVRVGVSDPEIVPPEIPTTSPVAYFHDRYMHSRRSYLSAYDASEGSLYLLFVATLLGHPAAPRIFALDNIDGTLNPGLVRTLVEHVVKVISADDRRQIFFTSHNPTALDAVDIFDPNHRVYIVKRDGENGQTVFAPLLPPANTTRKQWIERAKGRNLSAMWLEELIPGALN